MVRVKIANQEKQREKGPLEGKEIKEAAWR